MCFLVVLSLSPCNSRLLIWKVIGCDIVEFGEKVREEACHTLR